MAIAGAGTIFKRWNTAEAIWETIANITNIIGPSITKNMLDTTALDTIGGYRTFISGLRDAGEVTMSMNFTRDGFDKMFIDFVTDWPCKYEIILPDEDITSISFNGLVTTIPLTIPSEIVTMEITIKISGPIIALNKYMFIIEWDTGIEWMTDVTWTGVTEYLAMLGN